MLGGGRGLGLGWGGGGGGLVVSLLKGMGGLMGVVDVFCVRELKENGVRVERRTKGVEVIVFETFLYVFNPLPFFSSSISLSTQHRDTTTAPCQVSTTIYYQTRSPHPSPHLTISRPAHTTNKHPPPQSNNPPPSSSPPYPLQHTSKPSRPKKRRNTKHEIRQRWRY